MKNKNIKQPIWRSDTFSGLAYLLSVKNLSNNLTPLQDGLIAAMPPVNSDCTISYPKGVLTNPAITK